MLNINNLQKKTLKITIPIFLMMVFSFIFIPGFKVKAEELFTLHNIDELELFDHEITEDYLYSAFDIDKNEYPYVFMWVGISEDSPIKGNRVYLSLFFHKKNPYIEVSSRDDYWNFHDFNNTTVGYVNITNYNSWFRFNIGSKVNITNNYTKNINSNGVYTTGCSKNLYYFSNYDIVYHDTKEVAIPSSKPKSYTFNEDIVVTDISKIKVKFKLPSNTSNLAIDFKYKISQLGFGVGTLGDPYVSLKSIENNIEKTSINSFKSYRNRDHLIEEMKNCVSNYYNSIGATHDGSKSFDTLISKLNSISRYDDHKNLEIESAIKSVFVENDELFVTLYPLALRYVDQDYCSGTYVVSLLPDSTVYEYTFEVDVYNYEGSINLNFTSNLNYEIDYEYKSDLNNFLTTINMDNYSALILIPKVKNLESGSLSSISSDVYLSGIYDINLLEDIDSKNVLYHHNDYDYSVFSHYQDYHYLNATLLFVKKSFGSVNNTITFDSRYYSYVTKFNLSDEVTINNPNTGEDIIIGDISDFYDYGLDNKKFTFNSFLKPIKFVFESITNFYKNYCPELVQNFFYLIFVFFVVLVLIRIFL